MFPTKSILTPGASLIRLLNTALRVSLAILAFVIVVLPVSATDLLRNRLFQMRFQRPSRE